jgi:AcrR family transcriptional regulator
MDTPSGLSGRKAQALRNDGTILAAARDVFMRDPDAPVAAVAKEAGVGVSALYRRYASKEVLLQTLCMDGLDRFIAIAEECLALDEDQLGEFVRGIVDADVHSLTVHLAGTFTPTPELYQRATDANALATRIFRRARAAGEVRSDLHVNDLSMIFEQCAAIRMPDAERTRALRRRYVEMQVQAMRPAAATTRLPGPAPTAAELGARWTPR